MFCTHVAGAGLRLRRGLCSSMSLAELVGFTSFIAGFMFGPRLRYRLIDRSLHCGLHCLLDAGIAQVTLLQPGCAPVAQVAHGFLSLRQLLLPAAARRERPGPQDQLAFAAVIFLVHGNPVDQGDDAGLVRDQIALDDQHVGRVEALVAFAFLQKVARFIHGAGELRGQGFVKGDFVDFHRLPYRIIRMPVILHEFDCVRFTHDHIPRLRADAWAQRQERMGHAATSHRPETRASRGFWGILFLKKAPDRAVSPCPALFWKISGKRVNPFRASIAPDPRLRLRRLVRLGLVVLFPGQIPRRCESE